MNSTRTKSRARPFVFRSAGPRLRPSSQHDPVAKTPATRPLRIDGKALGAKASLETRFPSLRPNAEDATWAECPPASFNRLATIKGISILIGMGMWTLEKIEHDRIVGASAGGGFPNAIGHIANS